MKNTHLLPTDKPSRLHITSRGKLILSTIPVGSKGETQNIYITNDEEIKKGDWVTDGKNVIKCYLDWWVDFCKNKNRSVEWKKIIITTSENLIKDGVQVIDDEFLEWFINNPSCEEVEIIDEIIEDTSKDYIVGLGQPCRAVYKIIISKEERERGITITHAGKQETLEEVINKILSNNNLSDEDMILSDTFSKVKNSMIDITKWQQEQDLSMVQGYLSANLKNIELLQKSYSEEEVLQLLLRLKQTEFYDNLYEWFEQFKKK